MSGGRRLTLRNMIVRGFSPHAGVHSSYYIGGRSYEWQHAYEFSGVSGGLLDHVQAYGVYGDFVEAQADQRPGRRGQPSRDITVRASRFAGAARQGFGLTAVDGMTIEGNRIRDVAQAGVDLEPNPPHPLARNVTVTGNAFADVWFGIVSVNGIAAANTDGVGNVSITGNTMLPPSGPGRESCFAPIWVNAANGASTANYTIARNQLVSIGPGIYMMGVRGARIFGNRLSGRPGCRRSAGVELHRSTGVVIGSNQFGARPAVVAAAE
jgi:nitrous oxidase accessory protein NosD